jgi:dienelactone hydrolase
MSSPVASLLIAHPRRQQNVDWHHIGLVGHSLGAQAILTFPAQAASPVDAVVSLDTTQSLPARPHRRRVRGAVEGADGFWQGMKVVVRDPSRLDSSDAIASDQRIVEFPILPH